MENLAKYKDNTTRIAELLPWAALVASGVVLNKDGSFQRTIRFRGPDLESATESQLISAVARLNNALRRLGSGWVMYVEAKRHQVASYLEVSQFPEAASWLVDAERRSHFESLGRQYESHYYLTLQYLTPAEATGKLSDIFVVKPESLKAHAYEKDLDYFSVTVQRFYDILKDFMYEVSFLNDDETLTYLHSCVSTKNHMVKAPDAPMYLDGLLADEPLLTGIAPQLGNQHIRVLTILGFPSHSLPAILDQLNYLPIEYRWVTRFIPLDKLDAEKELKRYRQRWFAKRKSLLNLLQEVFTKNESQLLDTAAVEKAKDADLALRELAEDYVSFGFYTATITVMDESLENAESKIREIERIINGLGFSTIYETFNAVEAWLSSLPGQAYANIRRPLLHSLNLAHMLPFSALWTGPTSIPHLNNAPPLMMVDTEGRTPFRFSNYIEDVGHQMIIGPTGAGKSVLLSLMAMQFRRYQNAQVFVFDKGGSFMASTHAVGGDYFELGEASGLAFQPLAHIDSSQEKIWAAEWLTYLLEHEQIKVTPWIKSAVWEALNSLAALPRQQRTLTGFRALVQHQEIRQALTNYTLEGPFGYLLDADDEHLSQKSWQCFEMETLMNMPSIVAPVLNYLFHRLEKKFTGVPTLLILDEAWLFLDHPQFATQIRQWLKTLRKLNVAVIFATQSVADALSAAIAPALLESCPSRILLPNDRIFEPEVFASYQKLGLNDRQCQLLGQAMPKRQYYYQSRVGNRLFNLECGPVTLAFCGAAKPEDRQLIRDIAAQYGEKEFLQKYLEAKQLPWAIKMAEDFFE